MTQIYLIEGPVGAGKSTFALRLATQHKGLHLALDDWMTTLFSPDRPETYSMDWYIERKDRCIKQIWKLTCSLIDSGIPVVLELGLVRRISRQYLYELADVAGYNVSVYVLDTLPEIRRERVKQRNKQKGETFYVEVPDQFFNFANSMWEPPDQQEQDERDIQFITTG